VPDAPLTLMLPLATVEAALKAAGIVIDGRFFINLSSTLL
jgi:hypothetical protein